MAPIGTEPLIRSVAALNDLDLELPKWTVPDKPARFTSKFPYGKIPALEGSDGFKLIEGMTIARYSGKVNLLGYNVKEIALVDQWIHFAEHEIGGPLIGFLGMVYVRSAPFNRETLDKYVERLVRALDYVESYLASHPSGYLVSDSVTLADFALAAMVYGCSHTALGAAERAKYPAIYAHYAKVTADDKVKEFWGTKGFTQVAITEPTPMPTI